MPLLTSTDSTIVEILDVLSTIRSDCTEIPLRKSIEALPIVSPEDNEDKRKDPKSDEKTEASISVSP